MSGGTRKKVEKREVAVDQEEEEANEVATTTEPRRVDGVQEANGSSKLGSDQGCEATPSTGSRTFESRLVRPWKEVNPPQGENDCTLEVGGVESPRRDQNNTDERSHEVDILLEDVEEALVADEGEEVADVEVNDVEADVTPSAAAAHPGANNAVTNKAVRRLSFSSGEDGGANEPKRLKLSSGTAKEQRKVPKKPVSKTKKAGLVLSVSRVHNRLKEDRYASRVRVNAAVYLAATLEYLVAEVLELAGNCARYFKKKRVTPRHIQLTLLHDLELKELTKGVIVPEGGVKENNIHKELLPKNSASAHSSEEDRHHDSES